MFVPPPHGPLQAGVGGLQTFLGGAKFGLWEPQGSFREDLAVIPNPRNGPKGPKRAEKGPERVDKTQKGPHKGPKVAK